MALIQIDQVGQIGIVKDINAWQLPNNVWTDGNNVRAEHGAIQKTQGYAEVMASCPVAPYHVVNLEVGSSNYWIIAGLTKIYVHNGTSWTNITRQTTGSDVNYNATAKEGWTSTILGGTLVMANGYDVPQFWALSSGVPSVSTKMAALSNWAAGAGADHYPFSVRAFRSFLVALNVTQAGVPYTRLVKWSHEAATQTVPSSWDETSATVDAGEYELADTSGKIVDGMPLGDTFMIYKEDSIYSMQFVGTPFIFSFRQLSPTVGALSKNCVAEFEDKHFIFGNGDMYVSDGRQVKSILPHKMRDYVFGNINGDEYEKSFVAPDYGATEMWACYVTSGNASAQCDKALVWNWINNTFTERDLPNLGFISYGTQADPATTASWNAASTTWITETKNWNDITSSSFTSKEGKSLIMVSPTDTKLYRHNTGNKNNTSNMSCFIERTGLTMDAQGQPNQSMVKHVTSIWPKMSVSEETDVNVYVGSSMSSEEAIAWEGPYTFNPDEQSKVSVRVSGKYIGVKFESTGDQTWRLDGYSLDVQNAGIRGSKMRD